jgi:hypothetical protein
VDRRRLEDGADAAAAPARSVDHRARQRSDRLALITNLDPTNIILEQRYQEIVNTYPSAEVDRQEYDTYWRLVDVQPSADLMSFEQLTSRFCFDRPRPSW